MGFKIDRSQYIPSISENNKTSGKRENNQFEKLFQESIGKKQGIKISSHAQQRIKERNVILQDDDMTAISNAMDELETKGARESLMLYKDMAFIASVSNRTIITALQEKDTDIVTNIDSAVIIK